MIGEASGRDHRGAMLTRAAVKAFSMLGRALCRFRGTRPVDGLARCVHAMNKGLANTNFELRTNGERRVLELLARAEPRILFDVGANRGEWSALASALCPACEIHAFEVVPQFTDQLRRAVAACPNVRVNGFGLSDRTGTITVSLSADASPAATACPIHGMSFHDDYYTYTAEGRVETAAAYMAREGIETVDFVKIDVEGMDLRVIRGFGDRLDRVRAIQFEYGVFNIASRDLLVDFHRHLGARGFVVGKIYPRYVDFSEYHFDHETFYGGNHLAVRTEETALIRDLAGGHAIGGRA